MLIHIGLDPVLIMIGGLKIHWYGVMVAIGLYAGIQVALRDAPRRGVDRDKLLNASLIAAVLGVLGGRLYYVVQNHPEYYLQHPGQILAVWQGGMAFYGAIFGGALALLIGSWRYGMVAVVAGVLALPGIRLIGMAPDAIARSIYGTSNPFVESDQGMRGASRGFVRSRRHCQPPPRANGSVRRCIAAPEEEKWRGIALSSGRPQKRI